MSEDLKNVEARVDELSKPENKAELNKALNEEFNAGTQNPAEAKPAETVVTDPAAPAENKPGEGDKGGNADDPLKPNVSEAEERKNKVAALLADKNAAQNGAAEAQTEVQILTKRVEDLTKLLEKSAGNGGEVVENKNLGADDPDKDKPVSQIVKETLEKLDTEKKALADAEKSQTEQIQALETNKETPNAKEYADEIKAVMLKFKDMSAVGAYGFLKGNGIIPSGEALSSNANRTGAGNRSKTALLDNKKPEDMTQAERFELLKQEEKAGNLKGQI